MGFDVQSLVERLAGHWESMIETRRVLHSRPELAFQEEFTARYIAEQLHLLGLVVRERVGGTGVVAHLTGGQPGPHVLLRADMDALALSEGPSSKAYRSERPGISHACGHDGHVAILIAVAQVLAEVRSQWSGSVTFVFQPAEETLEGAAAMIRDGLLDSDQFDAAFALHLWNFLPFGTVGVRAGVSHAGVDQVGITVHGLTGHGGMPHLGRDAFAALADILSASQRMLSREVSPFEPAVLTFGEIDAGNVYNATPGVAMASGSLRTLKSETHDYIIERLNEVVDGIAAVWRVQAKLNVRRGTSPVLSAVQMVDIVRDAACETVGQENVVEHDIVMGGDDMAEILHVVPGCYFVVGSQSTGDHRYALHHNEGFDFEERAMDVAARVMLRSLHSFSCSGRERGR